MKKKAIEKIPYFGLKETSRKKAVKYIGVTAVKIVGHGIRNTAGETNEQNHGAGRCGTWPVRQID